MSLAHGLLNRVLLKSPVLQFALMRHGDYHQQQGAPSAMQPWPLTERGRAQALTAAKTLLDVVKQQAWEVAPVVLSSSSLRAWQTASILISALNENGHQLHEHRVTDALCERSVGILANLTEREIEQAMANDPRYPSLAEGWKSNPDFRLPVPGAESLTQAGQRVAQCLTQHFDSMTVKSGSLPVVVGHGASIRNALVALGLFEADDLEKLSMHHAQPMVWARAAAGQPFELLHGQWKPRAASQQKD